VTAAAAQDTRPPRRSPTTADGQEATWRERALNAEEALKTAHTEIRTQRSRIGDLLGQIRDLEAEWTQDAIQRITTENTTLKQRLRQLTNDHRTLEERLQAARSNLRFQDRRVADLEARLTEPLIRSTNAGDRTRSTPD
jgi:chromosome segregation ATPase